MKNSVLEFFSWYSGACTVGGDMVPLWVEDQLKGLSETMWAQGLCRHLAPSVLREDHRLTPRARHRGPALLGLLRGGPIPYPAPS